MRAKSHDHSGNGYEQPGQRRKSGPERDERRRDPGREPDEGDCREERETPPTGPCQPADSVEAADLRTRIVGSDAGLV